MVLGFVFRFGIVMMGLAHCFFLSLFLCFPLPLLPPPHCVPHSLSLSLFLSFPLSLPLTLSLLLSFSLSFFHPLSPPFLLLLCFSPSPSIYGSGHQKVPISFPLNACCVCIAFALGNHCSCVNCTALI